jgi:spore coat polysaccharide biosynthesis predicted glycosyltransferase SpsG
MRTLPLAEELKKRDHHVIYVGSEEFPSWVLTILKQSQFQLSIPLRNTG